VSASLTARVTGHRVEDLSQRTEFTRVYANPEGTWTSETASEPESVQDDQGGWHAIDTTLVPREGGFAPVYGVSDVVLSDGGDKTLVSMSVPTDAGGTKQLDWRWPTTLPVPSVEGNTATYANAFPGADLVVTATTTGFEHSLVLDAPPTQPIEVTLPVVTRGADLVTSPGDSLAIRTASGDTLMSAPQPLMWDSSSDAGGEPQVAPVGTSIGQTASGTPTLTLSPDQGFLADPATVYPVTIDPSLSPDLTADTWVQNADYTSSQNTSTELRAGTYDGGGHVARSFLKFNASGRWNGKHILSAGLTLRNWYSGSCTGAAIRVQRLTEPWSATGMTWANQPGAGTGFQDDYAPARGYNSSCPGGDATWDLRDMVQDWAAGGFTNNGIRIKAVDETSVYTWRKYRSGDYGGSVIPRLEVTYNSYPNTAGAPTVVTSPASNARYSVTTTPTFKANVSDPDGGQVRGYFEVLESGSSKWTGTSGYVTSGSTASKAIGSGLLYHGHTYTIRVKSDDGTDKSAAWAQATFTVDTSKPATTVTSSSFTNGQWTTTVPASNTFTLDGPPDTKSFAYTLDGVTQPVKTANTSGDATVSWLPTKGSHALTATARDTAGNTGPMATFAFGVGPASFTTPNPELRSTGVFPIAVGGPPNATGATLSWRYAGSSTWNATTGVTKAGSAWNGAVTQGAAGSETGTLLWTATNEVDPASTASTKLKIAAPAHLELRACFTYSGSPSQVCSDPRPVQLVPSAFGGNFPVTSVGPATVALFTGEATISAVDAQDTGAGVGRTFSSFDASTATGGPFGQGWATSLIGAGNDGAELIDNRTQDHYYDEFDEYGNAIGSTSVTRPFGWLGKKQQATRSLDGMVLIGARVYNPSLGSFLQRDPVQDGGATAYAYPFDPVNMSDTTGLVWDMRVWNTKRLSLGVCTRFGIVRSVLGCGFTGTKASLRIFDFEIHLTPRDLQRYSDARSVIALVTTFTGAIALALGVDVKSPLLVSLGIVLAGWDLKVQFAHGRGICIHIQWIMKGHYDLYAGGVKFASYDKEFPYGKAPYLIYSQYE
jgi:RHS repeat-associated protein